jgi:hypothetical protein
MRNWTLLSEEVLMDLEVGDRRGDLVSLRRGPWFSVNRHRIGTPDRPPRGTPRWARSGARPGGAVRMAEAGRVPLR